MSALVGDKLFEAATQIQKTREVIAQLEAKVEFPDVRSLVNQGTIGLAEVIEIRKRAGRFRKWLQEEGDRDRDAIIAYHNEVAQEAGFVSAGRRVLPILGFIGVPFVTTAVMAARGGAFGAPIGGASGAGVVFLATLASRIGAGRKPIVFGEWTKDRIARHVERSRADE